MSVEYQPEFDAKSGVSSIVETLGGDHSTQIFVHGMDSIGNPAQLAITKPGFHKYPERALVVARPNDFVCVLDRVDDRYLRFLSTLGVGPHEDNIIVASKRGHRSSSTSLSDVLMSNHDALLAIRERVQRDMPVFVNPFLASPKEFEFADALGTVVGRHVHVLGGHSDTVDYVNQKHNARSKALELGVPVPEGETIELQLRQEGTALDIAPLRIAINRYIHRTGRVLIKGSRGSSGSSLVIVEDNPESIEKSLNALARRVETRIYLVEVMLDVAVSPNVLIYIDPINGRLSCVCVTDQRLSEHLAHEGNIFPPSASTVEHMINSAMKISAWLRTQGCSGLAGFDFGEYLNPETGACEYFLADINARTNGAAYPKFLMEHLNRRQRQKDGPCIKAFLSDKAVPTKARFFAELDEWCGHLFFTPATGKGVVPYNTGCLEIGMCSLAVFGKSGNEVTEIYEEFKAASHGIGTLA